MIFFRCRQKCP